MSQELPIKPNLEYLKNQAKQRLRQLKTSDPRLKLADAQHLIARDYGFSNWSQLKQHVETLLSVLAPAEQLAIAVCASDATQTAKLLKSHPELGPQLNEPMIHYGVGMQALLAAVQRSDRKTIDVLLSAGADINARSRWWAGGVGVLDECSPEIAEFLMERGASLNAHSAARLGRLEQLKEFVAAADVGTRGANGETVLHFASTVPIAEYLLDQGAELDARDLLHESTPAQHMLRVVQARHFPRDRQDIARLLVARGCRTDILMAAALGDLALVRHHVDTDPTCIRTRVSPEHFPKKDPRSESSIYFQIFGANRTPHMVARDFDHPDVFQLLLTRTPADLRLAQACELGDEASFRELLAAHPDLVATLNNEGLRRLPDAAQNNNPDAVRLMLAAGWPVDVRGELGLTALAWASWHGNAGMVKEILRYHPQIEHDQNEYKITVLTSALHGSENSWHRQTGDYGATVQALLDAGAKPPKLTDDLEASEAARQVLRRNEEHMNRPASWM